MNRINLICLGVKDLRKSLAFYKDIGFSTPDTADIFLTLTATTGN